MWRLRPDQTRPSASRPLPPVFSLPSGGPQVAWRGPRGKGSVGERTGWRPRLQARLGLRSGFPFQLRVEKQSPGMNICRSSMSSFVTDCFRNDTLALKSLLTAGQCVLPGWERGPGLWSRCPLSGGQCRAEERGLGPRESPEPATQEVLVLHGSGPQC